MGSDINTNNKIYSETKALPLKWILKSIFDEAVFPGNWKNKKFTKENP